MRKIFLTIAYALSFTLPAVILIYLGANYAKQERILLENQEHEKIQILINNTADKVNDVLNKNLSNILRAFEPMPDQIEPGGYLKLKAYLNESYCGGMLEGILIFNSQKNIIYPLLAKYVPPQPLASHPADATSDFTLRYQKAQNAQFINKSYIEAAALYNDLRDETADRRWKGILGYNIAVCWVEAGKLGYAKNMLEEIVAESGGFFDDKEQPIGILAIFEIAEILKKQNELTKRSALLANLAKDIFVQKWVISEHKRSFYLNRLKEYSSEAAAAEDLRRQEAVIADNYLMREQSYVLDVVRKMSADDFPLLIKTKSKTIIYSGGSTAPGNTVKSSVVIILSAKYFDYFIAKMPGLSVENIQFAYNEPKCLLRGKVAFVNPEVWFWAPYNSAYLNIYYKKVRLLWLIIGGAFFVVTGGLLLSWRAVRKEKEVAVLKSRIVAGVSHDLKTPISAISMISEKLCAGRYRSKDDLAELFGTLNGAAQRLKALVMDVLDFSRILDKNNSYRFEKFELCGFINETLNQLPADRDKIEVFCRQDIAIEADRVHFGRAIINLVDNAIKYSPADRLDIKIIVTAKRNNAIIKIVDKGYGIKHEDMPYIFGHFYRGTRAVEGSGLGLSIVRHIVELHGGTIKVESTPGEGSTFTVGIPMRRQDGKNIAC